MAVIDPNSDCVVIRVVYDGAPMAGKTTSVATLGSTLGAGVYSPADLHGRTLYFDWLDYTGGLFEGRRIRCQIVTVPGQATLAPRRRRLLESADAVVFVGDSSPTGFAADRRQLRSLSGVLKNLSGPPVGLVLQANKRDRPDATPLHQLRSMLDELDLRSAIIESIATKGTGIRETFVFAVRLALDRVRELMRAGALSTMAPKINSAQDLLREMQLAEGGALDLAVKSESLEHTRTRDVQQISKSLASQALQEAMQVNVDTASPTQRVGASSEDGPPAVPNETVASGLVWPPVDGRMILHETTRAAVDLERTEDGGWTGVIGDRWRLHSASRAQFDTVDEGRAELVKWARLHVDNDGILSKQRCIVLADDGQGRVRLWQIVRAESSLRAQIEAALTADAKVLTSTLLSVANAFLHMAERLTTATCELQLSLDYIARSSSGPIYSGWLPQPSSSRPTRHRSPFEATELLFSELAFAQSTLRAQRSDVLGALSKLSRSSNAYALTEWHFLQRFAAVARD
jgi:signal recognition particle receptor subunit beta